MEELDKKYFDEQFDEIRKFGPRLDDVEDRLTRNENNISWIMRIGGSIGTAFGVVFMYLLKRSIGN